MNVYMYPVISFSFSLLLYLFSTPSCWWPLITTTRMLHMSQMAWLWCGIWNSKRPHLSTSITVRWTQLPASWSYAILLQSGLGEGVWKLMYLTVPWLFNAYGTWLFKFRHKWGKGNCDLMALSAWSGAADQIVTSRIMSNSSWTKKKKRVRKAVCEKHWVGFHANYKGNQMKCKRPGKQVCEATAWCEALHTPTRARYYRDISV